MYCVVESINQAAVLNGLGECEHPPPLPAHDLCPLHRPRLFSFLYFFFDFIRAFSRNGNLAAATIGKKRARKMRKETVAISCSPNDAANRLL